MAAITERARRDLYEHAEETWGKEAADTLMAHLPPTGWADVATKTDLALLRAEMEALLHRELGKQTRTFFAMTLTAVIAVSGLPQVLGKLL
jgi:hypothetical protein